MITGIKFLKDFGNSEMLGLTEQNIIICQSPNVKQKLYEVLTNGVTPDSKTLDYDSEKEEDKL